MKRKAKWHQMNKKVKAKEAALEAVEMVKDIFPDSTPPIEEIKNIFAKVDYGEILFKIIDGEIESIQIVQNYKPIVIDKES